MVTAGMIIMIVMDVQLVFIQDLPFLRLASERAVKCIHTVSSSLCPECVDESDEAKAEREDSSWCCALCADFYNLWSRRTRTRGIFLKTARLDRAKLGVTDEAENAPGSAKLSKTIVQLANSDAIGDGAGHSKTNKNNTTPNNKRRWQQSQQREDTQVGNGAGPSNQAKTTPSRQQPQQQHQPALAIDCSILY